MCSSNPKLKQFACDLYKINAVKFGEYKTKVGLMTPVYCDLRVIVSYPNLLETLAELMVEKLQTTKYNVVCGVPYTALPIATVVSLKTRVPMVMRRKEAKDYGTKKLIEGVFNEGEQCLIVEDVVTSGSSILETTKDLRNAGLKCTDAIVLLNREQGGAKILQTNGIQMHALLGLGELMIYLKEAGFIDEATVGKVRDYLGKTQIDEGILLKEPAENRLKLSYSSRASLAKNPSAAQLFNIMTSKETNLCVAADLTNPCDVLNLAEAVGPHICALKTHIDIIKDFNENLIAALKEIAERHNFLLFEDRKFADIGKTVEHQFQQGVFQISSWAKLVTAHSITGPGVLDAIRGVQANCGVFLLAETSAAGSLINADYTKATLKLAGDYQDLVAGIVCQSPLFLDCPGFIQLTPGVQISAKSDQLGQQYNSPGSVVLERGADVAVVGRGITQAEDPASAAIQYKALLWNAYLQRVKA